MLLKVQMFSRAFMFLVDLLKEMQMQCQSLDLKNLKKKKRLIKNGSLACYHLQDEIFPQV
jgi:hypothetical protein